MMRRRRTPPRRPFGMLVGTVTLGPVSAPVHTLWQVLHDFDAAPTYVRDLLETSVVDVEEDSGNAAGRRLADGTKKRRRRRSSADDGDAAEVEEEKDDDDNGDENDGNASGESLTTTATSTTTAAPACAELAVGTILRRKRLVRGVAKEVYDRLIVYEPPLSDDDTNNPDGEALVRTYPPKENAHRPYLARVSMASIQYSDDRDCNGTTRDTGDGPASNILAAGRDAGRTSSCIIYPYLAEERHSSTSLLPREENGINEDSKDSVPSCPCLLVWSFCAAPQGFRSTVLRCLLGRLYIRSVIKHVQKYLQDHVEEAERRHAVAQQRVLLKA